MKAYICTNKSELNFFNNQTFAQTLYNVCCICAIFLKQTNYVIENKVFSLLFIGIVIQFLYSNINIVYVYS
jgi:hypothetical protein